MSPEHLIVKGRKILAIEEHLHQPLETFLYQLRVGAELSQRGIVDAIREAVGGDLSITRGEVKIWLDRFGIKKGRIKPGPHPRNDILSIE